MRGRIGLIWGLVTVLVATGVGFAAYQAGWAGGVATHLPANAGGAPYYYGYHPYGFGFLPFFGILPLLLIILLVVLLFRGFGRRPWGWGGPAHGGYGGHGFPGGPPPWVEQRMREWHERTHSAQSGGPPPAPGETSPSGT